MGDRDITLARINKWQHGARGVGDIITELEGWKADAKIGFSKANVVLYLLKLFVYAGADAHMQIQNA